MANEGIGLKPVIINDIASSGRTLVAAGVELRNQGFPASICVIVHALFGGEAFAKTSAAAARIVSTDTAKHPSNAITVTSLIANALAGCSRS